jgi:hypothetical protein
MVIAKTAGPVFAMRIQVLSENLEFGGYPTNRYTDLTSAPVRRTPIRA